MKKLQILIIAFLIALSICTLANFQVKAQTQYLVTFSSSGLGGDATGNLVSFSVSGGSILVILVRLACLAVPSGLIVVQLLPTALLILLRAV